jgi:hypothetical protein
MRGLRAYDALPKSRKRSTPASATRRRTASETVRLLAVGIVGAYQWSERELLTAGDSDLIARIGKGEAS